MAKKVEVTANQDKVTKRMIRFNIEENESGVVGVVYLPRKRAGKVKMVTVKLEKGEKEEEEEEEE